MKARLTTVATHYAIYLGVSQRSKGESSWLSTRTRWLQGMYHSSIPFATKILSTYCFALLTAIIALLQLCWQCASIRC